MVFDYSGFELRIGIDSTSLKSVIFENSLVIILLIFQLYINTYFSLNLRKLFMMTNKKNDLYKDRVNVVLKRINKHLISAVLGILLNFTVLVPVTSAARPSRNLNTETVQYLVSNKIKKPRNKTSSETIHYSQKKERKKKQESEKRARINLLKSYLFLKLQVKKLNPSLNNCLKISTIPTASSQNQENIIRRIKAERVRSIRSGTTSDDKQSGKKASPNVASSVLKIKITKLLKKFQFVTRWIKKNPSLFSMGIVANVSLIYFYRNGYFVQWYNLIQNSSPRFLELANNFNKYFQEENKYFSFYEKVHAMNPEYFNKDYIQRHVGDFSILRKDLINQQELSSKEKPRLYVEEQQDLYSSKKQVANEPSLEDYADHFQYWELISDLNDKDNLE